MFFNDDTIIATSDDPKGPYESFHQDLWNIYITSNSPIWLIDAY